MTGRETTKLPLFDHPLDAPTVFKPADLLQAVRDQRQLKVDEIPAVCVLDFDGDLIDSLIEAGEVRKSESWACFHTSMWLLNVDGHQCGIIGRTIGGPYAVLIAEQLLASGVRVTIGLTSAGRVSKALPVPGIVVVERAIRDEGTSYHYLPPAETVVAPAALIDALYAACASMELPVLRGLVWTTDAPYRETEEQLARYSKLGALAVEMQAASLFAFAAARNSLVGVLAHVTNAHDHEGEAFDKGEQDLQRRLLYAACRAGLRVIREHDGSTR